MSLMNLFTQYLETIGKRIQEEEDLDIKNILRMQYRGCLKMLRVLFPQDFNISMLEHFLTFIDF